MSAAARDDLRKGWCPGALRPMMTRDGLLVRLRITGGIVPAALARAIADLAERHGNGLLDLSARANLQLRGVRAEELPALLEALEALGLLDEDAGAEAVRNVLSSPLAGLGRHPPPRSGGGGPPQAVEGAAAHQCSMVAGRRLPEEVEAAAAPSTMLRMVPLPRFAEEDIPDIRPLVAALERALVADPALRSLPPKFGILVDDGGAPSLAGISADIRFDWVAAERGFAVGLGGTAAEALALGLVAPDALVACAIALAHRLLAHPGEPRRVAKLIRETGAEATLLWFGDELPVIPGRAAGENPEPIASLRKRASRRDRWVPGPAAPPRHDESQSAVEAIAGFHTFGGIPTLGLAVPFGRLDGAMLRAAAHLAAEAGTGELRLTPWRTILVPHASNGDLAALAAAGFIVDPADPRLRVAACTGRAGCERGTTDTHADATALADLAAALPDEGVSLHVSGCAKGCARPQRTAITLVGRDGRYDLVRDGRPGDKPVLQELDLAAVRAELDGVRQGASSSAKREKETMRGTVEGAAASTLSLSARPEPTQTKARQPLPPPAAVPLPRFTGENARAET